jgi:hypothetical protein
MIDVPADGRLERRPDGLKLRTAAWRVDHFETQITHRISCKRRSTGTNNIQGQCFHIRVLRALHFPQANVLASLGPHAQVPACS